MKIPFLNKTEFRPDRRGTGQLRKLWPTPTQQLRILRWALFGAVCLLGLLAQDVLLYRIDVAGGCTDLVPCLVLMVVAITGAHSGCIFALIAGVLYYFSGSSAGFHVIALLTVVAVLAAVFRQAFLRRGFWAVLLCVALGMAVYELVLFAISLFLGLSVASRLGATLATVGLSLVAVPIFYPVLAAVGKLGGEAWQE